MSGKHCRGCWLAGLVDGEGTFALQAKRRGPGNRYKRVEFSFKIALRADDRDTILEAQKILGGNLGYLSNAGREGRSAGGGYKGHALYQLYINRRDHLHRVIEFFREHPLRSKKRQDFEIWAEALEWYQAQIESAPYSKVRHGVFDKKSRKGKRMPLVGTPRKQFRAIPDPVFEEMEKWAARLRESRTFNGVK